MKTFRYSLILFFVSLAISIYFSLTYESSSSVFSGYEMLFLLFSVALIYAFLLWAVIAIAVKASAGKQLRIGILPAILAMAFSLLFWMVRLSNEHAGGNDSAIYLPAFLFGVAVFLTCMRYRGEPAP